MTRARDIADFGSVSDRLDTLGGSEGALSNRNLIINGAFQVAARGTTSTDNGFATVDRFKTSNANNDESPTQAQHALTSSDTGVYEKGFRNSYRITNGNQTSGAGAADRVTIQYNIEAQDLAKSGWDYTSSSNYITLSFYCRSSVAQNFYGRLQTLDGTQQAYAFETGSLTANTWTQITKTIPGNSNITINDDTGSGMTIEFVIFRGTDKTGSMSLDSWAAFDTNVRVPDMTSTWYTTDDATFEITGVQLEVGSTATDFEHRSFGDELLRCQRYFYKKASLQGSVLNAYSTAKAFVDFPLPVPMRASPAINTMQADRFALAGVSNITSDLTSEVAYGDEFNQTLRFGNADSDFTAGLSYIIFPNSTDTGAEFDAEL